MIEVAFNDSTAGTLREALHSGMLGSDVVSLEFELDIGSIQKPVTSKYRAKLLCDLYNGERWGPDDPEMKRELARLGHVYRAQLEKLFEYLGNGEPIRIWYSSAPYSMCGLMWLCSELEGREASVSVVRLPHVVVSGNTLESYSMWGQVEPDKLPHFLKRERKLSEVEISVYAHSWSGLKRENAPLRAVVNGTVISVPASFYDFLIWKYLGDNEPIMEAYLLGQILGDNQLGVSVCWYERRIDKFIAENRVKIVRDSPVIYQRILAINHTEKTPAKSRSKRARFWIA